jgi:two-component system sensor histidine kinase KdpD
VSDELRPDPDRLLDLVQQESNETQRGRLKIFFGASAGVGKTYAMLNEARNLKREGANVLVGIVETHGREETAALLHDLAVLPRRKEQHRGVTLAEFDLEGALDAKPDLILVDELAHTNAPGSRHPKRWQDVEELLARGIDVYTTLNVQHLESLNDMVARLTGIQVRETVPDTVFDLADDIALIDIPSDELLKRLGQGKVYIAPGAKHRAMENFFKKTNLVALREIALRRTAERVDAQMDLLTAAQGKQEARIGEKILVCVGHDAFSGQVIRHAKRLATRARARWIAAYVETGRHYRLTEKARADVERNLRLAERMGAQIINLKGNNAAEELLSYARSNGITRIIVGSRPQSHWRQILSGSLATDLLARAAGIEISAVTGHSRKKVGYLSGWRTLLAQPSAYGKALLILAALFGIVVPLRGIAEADNLIMIFQIGIIIIAARYGVFPSIMASVIGVALFNFTFVPPYYSLTAYDPAYYFTFAVMLTTSLFIGTMAAKLSVQAQFARKREQETALLYSLTRELSITRGLERMAELARRHVGEAFQAEVVVIIPHEQELRFYPENIAAHEVKEESVARWALENKTTAGRGTDTLPSARGLYLPLNVEDEIFGVLGVIPLNEREFGTEEEAQLETFAGLIASAFQRANKAEIAERSKLESESEKLRNVLLSSVSHDLRTPLASITGAASSLLMKKELAPESEGLVKSIHSQANRLSRLVTNLLDVTNLETGNIKLNKQLYDIAEIIGVAITRIEEIRDHRQIKVLIEPKLPMISLDGILVEQVLINLLENAVRYTKPHGHIEISVRRDNDRLSVRITDDGIGIPMGQEDKIFDKFYSPDPARSSSAGLGLAICRGIIHTHGGVIWANHRTDGGAEFIFTLPIG